MKTTADKLTYKCHGSSFHDCKITAARAERTLRPMNAKSTFRPVKLCDNVNAWMNPPKMARREITNGHGFCWRRFCSASYWRFYGWAMLRTVKRKNAILALRCRSRNVRTVDV